MKMKPPSLDDLRVGHKLIAGLGHSTVLADIDFETRSPAGFVWNPQTQKFDAPHGADKRGLPVIGASVYSEHPETEVICLAYNLKDGFGCRTWIPGQPAPIDLFIHLQQGGLLEAWNVAFEYYIWNNVCVNRYLFPPLEINSLRCAAAKSRAFSLPGSLEEAGKVLGTQNQKLSSGKLLIRKYCEPRKPSKKNPAIWNEFTDADFKLMLEYNRMDIKAESEISSQVPDLIPQELEFWLADQHINRRGVRLDKPMVEACIRIVEAAQRKYNAELPVLTGGAVHAASQIARIQKWMNSYGTFSPSLDEEHINELLNNPMLCPPVRRVLEIRKLIGSAAVKKLYAMINCMSADGRVRDLFMYHTARTGRAGGSKIQPQNLPNSNGVTVLRCDPCGNYYNSEDSCPWCGGYWPIKEEWNGNAVKDALHVISTGSLSAVEFYFGEAIATVAGCLRSLFIPAEGHDFLCSDYSAIESVVVAMLSGEAWRCDVFRTHGQIYEMSASKISGVPFDEFKRIKQETGRHHELRKLGKVAELASAYGGYIGSWLNFDADEFLTEEEIKRSVLAWRDASPMIVRMWKELEIAAHMAVLNKGMEFGYREIIFKRVGDCLYCELPSGRNLSYHRPEIAPNPDRPGTMQLSFEGWNSDATKGAIGWTRLRTYGARLFENVCQAVARDILAHAIVNLEKRGYPVVLHVHDEIVCEVPEDFGSVEELEAIMMELPQWASGWPIKAVNGWRGKRYRK